MTLGALLVTAAGGDGSVAQLLDIMPGPIGVFVLVMLFLGAIDAAVINLYGPSLCTLTLMQTFRTGWKPGAFARNLVATCTAVIAFMVALLFADNFLVNYSNFIHFLMCLLIPWSIVNLVDYYMIAKGQYDIAAFSDVNAGYGAFNIPALATYILGFVIQMPFMSGRFLYRTGGRSHERGRRVLARRVRGQLLSLSRARSTLRQAHSGSRCSRCLKLEHRKEYS